MKSIAYSAKPAAWFELAGRVVYPNLLIEELKIMFYLCRAKTLNILNFLFVNNKIILIHKEKKDMRRKLFKERELEESQMTETGYRLIYPLLTYEQEFFIEDKYAEEEALL